MKSMTFCDADTVDISTLRGIITPRRWGKVGEIRKKW